MTVNEPLRLSFEVSCPPPHAFEVWTSSLSRWWPTEHTVTGNRPRAIVLEPYVGGRIYERTAAGFELDWGEITEWEPPRRLGYRWHLRDDRADATEVAITFEEWRDSTTRIRIEHHGWERLGVGGPDWADADSEIWWVCAWGVSARTPVYERSSGCSGPYSCLTAESFSYSSWAWQ